MGQRPTQGDEKASVRQLLSIEPLPPPLSSRVAGWASGPPMRMKMASIQQPLSPEALPSPLSSRPERSAAERSLCGCLFLEMFFDGAKPRDLRFRGPLLETRILCNPLARKEGVSSSGPGKVRNVTDLQSVHLQLDADAFSPLQRSYDAKEVLGARVPVWPKHPLQAR
jgi:hypothetical protein